MLMLSITCTKYGIGIILNDQTVWSCCPQSTQRASQEFIQIVEIFSLLLDIILNNCYTSNKTGHPRP